MYHVQLKEVYDKRHDILLCDDDVGKQPKKRKNATLAYLGNNFFLIGGKLNNTACKSVWIFDLKNRCWRQIENKTFPLLEHHSVCIDGNEIVIFGGQFRNSTCAVYSFSDANKIKFSTFNGTIFPNYKQHSSVNFNCCLYIFGGWNETLGISNNVTKFDSTSGTSCIVKCASKVTPSPRYGQSAVVYSSCMIIIGGMDNNLTCCSDIWMFNFLSSCWEEIKPSSVRLAIYSHCAVLSNAHIIVTGGKLADDSINEDCWIFSLRNRTWTNLGCLMTPPGLKFRVTNMIRVSSLSTKHSVVYKSNGQLLRSATNHGFIHQDPSSFWTKIKTCSLTNTAKSTTIDERANAKCMKFALKTSDSSEIIAANNLEMSNRKDYTSKLKSSDEIFVFGTVEDSEYYAVYTLNLFCQFL